MKLCTKVALSWMIIFSLVKRLKTDDDASTTIQNVLSKVGSSNRELTTSLQGLKTVLADNNSNDYKPKVVAVIKSLGTALPKLSSDNGLEIAQGALDIIATIAEQFPGVGPIVAAVVSLISSILGLFTGAKVRKSTADIVREAMRGVSDENLEGEIQGAMTMLAASFDYLRPKRGTKLSAEAARGLTSKLQITTGLRALGMVSNRINVRKNSNVATEARQSIRFVMLYCQLFTMRDILYRELINLVRISDAPEEAESLASVRDGRIPEYQNTLRFLTEPEASNVAAVSYYYPPGRNTQSAYIKSCLNFVKLPTVPPSVDFLKSGAYHLFTSGYPHYVTFTTRLFDKDFLKVKEEIRDPNQFQDQKFVFKTDSEGFWYIVDGQKKKEWLARTVTTDGKWVFSTEGLHGDKNKFVIIKLKNGDLVFSPKKYPGKLWQVQRSFIGLANGKPGEQGYFKTFKFSKHHVSSGR